MELTTRRIRVIIVALESKTISYSECVYVVLIMQHAKRMRHITLSSMACPALPYFPPLNHKRHHFREKKLLNIKYVCLSIFTNLSETFLILRGIQRGIITNVYWPSCTVAFILLIF